MPFLRSASVACLFAATMLHAQSPLLLRDVRPGATGSGPIAVGDGGGLLTRSPRQPEILLALDDGVAGRELWRTNGTAAGTALLVDLSPGPAGTEFQAASSDPEFAWLSVVRAGIKELWRTDGTAAGTIRVFDGSALGAFAFVYAPDPRLVNGARLFRAGDTLWRTDGTLAGTWSLGVAASEPIVVEDGIAVYRSSSGNLVVTDGSTASTLGVVPGVIQVAEDGRLLVLQRTVSGMSPLWTVTWVNGPGAPSATFAAWDLLVVPMPGRFVVTTSQNELFGWDGLGAPELLRAFQPAPASTTWAQARRVGARVVMTGDDGVLGNEIWSTDGTLAGTRVLDLAPGAAGSDPYFRFEFGGRVMIWAQTPNGSEPWISDTSLNTATQLLDASTGPTASGPYFPDTGIGGARRLLFYLQTSSHGAEPWITDGTPAGTVLLGDVHAGSNGSYVGTWEAYPHYLACGSKMVWLANDGVHGAEPWVVSLSGTRTPLRSYGPRRFDVDDPVLGTTMALRASRLASNDLGVVAIGLPATVALPIAPARFLHLDASTAFLAAVVVPGVDGTWSGGFVLSSDPALLGLDAVVQPVFLAPALPIGLDVGDAFWLNLGF